MIGNPPYIRIQKLGRELASYCRDQFATAHGSFDAYIIFIERALEFLAPGGRLGFIVPNNLAKLDSARKLREMLADDRLVEEIVDFGDAQLFAGATNYTSILVLDKRGSDELGYRKVRRDGPAIEALSTLDSLPVQRFEVRKLDPDNWLLAAPEELGVIRAAQQGADRLGEVTEQIFQGLITSADDVYILESRGRRGRTIRAYSKALDREIDLEPDLLHPLASGRDVEPYAFKPLRNVLLFPYRPEDGEMRLLTATELERLPLTAEYLRSQEKKLRARERGRMDHDGWYAFGRTQSLALHERPKLGVAATVPRLEVAADPAGGIYFHNVRVNGILVRGGTSSAVWTLLALLNSRLLDFVFRRGAREHANGYFAANKQFIAPLPIRISAGDHAAALDQLGRDLYEISQRIVEERNGFLDWLGEQIRARPRDLAGKTQLESYDELDVGEVVDILQRNHARLSRRPDSRAFHDALVREHEESRSRLTELAARLSQQQRTADQLVYDLYELTDSQRSIVEAEHQGRP